MGSSIAPLHLTLKGQTQGHHFKALYLAKEPS